jgi:hypothetical protein
MNKRWRAGLMAAAVGLLVLPAAPASAGQTDAPEITWKLRSITLNGYTGNLVVKARVRCDGKGTASWTAIAVQDLRARGTADIVCDGDGRRSKIVLDPARGRFHPGEVAMDIALVACSKDFCSVSGQSFSTTV